MTDERDRMTHKEFEDLIEEEVQDLLRTTEKGDQAFLPEEYKRWRREGYSREHLEKDYDMCHIWR